MRPARLFALCLAQVVALAATSAAGQTLFNLGGSTASLPVTSLRDMPFRTVVRQQYDYSCGSAALATLLSHHYGHPVAEAAVFSAMYAGGDQPKIRRVGFSLLDMKRFLDARGLTANGYRWTPADLARSEAPVIALVQAGAYRHFVVVKGVRGGQVLVGDPTRGLKRYPLADFASQWTGVVLRIDPRPGLEPRYERADEWGSFTGGPFDPLSDEGLASFTRELPPIFQISTFRMGGGAVR